MNRRTWKPFVAAALLASLYMAGCNRQQGALPPSGTPESPKEGMAKPELPKEGMAKPELPKVTAVKVKRERVVLTSELPGRTASYLVAEIRPQVNGLIKKRIFEEGARVEAGDALYLIDPEPYDAAVANAAANLGATQQAAERARATLAATTAGVARHMAIEKLAVANLGRYRNLVDRDAVSQMDLDKAVAELETAQASLDVAKKQVESDEKAVEAADAAIKQAEAALKTAEINQGYTKITAPISGRIGRSHVTEGAIVTAYQSTPLATIQYLDKIYVDVTQSTVELNRWRRSLANGRLKSKKTEKKVKILLEDGTAYPLEGELQFRDVTVDPTTGSVILRIEVPNPELTLLPGMFVHAVIEEGVREQAILVPQQAVSRDQKGNPFVWTVNAKDMVESRPRPITTDRALGDKWLVSSGLEPGDRVIVAGMQKVQMALAIMRMPALPVKVTEIKNDETDAAAPDGAAKTAAAKPEGAAKTTAQLNQK